MDKQATLDVLETWSPEDRIDFLFDAWERLTQSGWQPRISDAQKTEFDRRLDALNAAPDDVVSWESVERYVKRAR